MHEGQLLLRIISDCEPTEDWLVLALSGGPGIAFTDHGLESLGASQLFFDGFVGFRSQQIEYDQDLLPPRIR
jgi:hypothetical protein